MTEMKQMLVKYDITAAGIQELREKYSIVPKVGCNADLKQLKRSITEVRTIRTSIEKKRKELKADALEYGRKVDGEARRITEELLTIEKPMKDEQEAYEAQVRARKAEKARIEAERVRIIQDKIEGVRLLPSQIIDQSSSEIEALIGGLVPSAKDSDFDFQEFDTQFDSALADTNAALTRLRDAALHREKVEAEAAERDRLAEIERKELAAEKARLDAEDKLRKQEAMRVAEEARLERERLAAIEREKLEAERKELEEQRRLAREEQSRKDKELAERERLAAAEQARLAAKDKALRDEEQRKIEDEERRVREEADRKEAEVVKERDRAAEEFKRTQAENKPSDAELETNLYVNTVPLVDWAEEAFDTIDAGFFSGDTFNNEDALKRVEYYLSRWTRQMVCIRQVLADDATEEEGMSQPPLTLDL